MVARVGVLCVAALLVLATACGSSAAKAKDATTADVYTAVLKHLVTAPVNPDDKQVVYVAPFANQKAIPLETQVDVIAGVADVATVRFVDELSEAVDDGSPGSPAKGAEVVLLGPIVVTGPITEVEAQHYGSETDQVRYRFRVSSAADGAWSAQQVEAVEVPPTTSA